MVEARRPAAAWHEVVHAHFKGTLGLVAAASGKCLKIQRDEERPVPGRAFKPINPRDLPALDLGESWFLGVLLCPGDSTDDLVAWARGLPRAALWRIRFYHTARVDLKKALAAWRDAGLPGAPTYSVRDFGSFHRLYGRHHGDIVYRDATRAPRKTSRARTDR